MDAILIVLHGVTVTPWKLVGYLGTFLFSARWLVQFHATKKHGRVHMPLSFWWLSIAGSLLTLSYFIWGKNDSVGILGTAFPAIVSMYNLIVELRSRAAATRS